MRPAGTRSGSGRASGHHRVGATRRGPTSSDGLEPDIRLRGKHRPSIASHLKGVSTAFGHHPPPSSPPRTWTTSSRQRSATASPPRRSTAVLSCSARHTTSPFDAKDLNAKPYTRKLPEQDARQGLFEQDVERLLGHLPETSVTPRDSHSLPAGDEGKSSRCAGPTSTKRRASSGWAPRRARTAREERSPSMARLLGYEVGCRGSRILKTRALDGTVSLSGRP